MATPFRILLILLAIVFAGCLAIAGFLLTLDVEKYRQDIVTGVRDATGLDLRLDGPIALDLWPSISLSVQDAAVDWEDAGDAPLASMRSLAFELPLLPLLTGNGIRIESVLVEGVALDLRIDETGRGNWLAPGDGGDDDTPSDPDSSDAEVGEGEVGLELTLQRLELVDLGMRYRDARDDTDVAISGLEILLVSDGADRFDATLGGRVDVKDGPRIGFGGAFSGDKELRDVRIAEITADIELPDWASALPVRISGSIERQGDTMTFDTMKIDVGELAMTLEGKVTQAGDRQAINLDLVLADSDLRALLARSGAAPETRDADALRHLAARVGLRGFSDDLRLDPLTIELDALDIAGTAGVRTTSGTDIRFALDTGRLNLLPYLPPPDAASAQTEAGPLVTEAPLGLDALADLVLDGRLTASAIILPGLEVGESKIGLVARGGKADLSMDLASVLGGGVDADARIDVTGATPRVTVTLDIDGLDATRVAPDAGFSGAVSLAGRLEARGESSAALARSVVGRLDLSGTPGVLDVRRLRAGLLPLAQLLGRSEKIAAWPDELRYERLSGNWNFTKGTAEQRGEVALDNMRLDATGGIALDTGVFDFRTGALFAAATPRTFDVPRDLDGIRLPSRCAGRLGEPGNPCGFDQQASGELVRQIAASKAGDAIRENLSEKLPEELRGPADAILRGLFGRPRQDQPE